MSVLKGSLREVRIFGVNLAATRTLTARLVSVFLYTSRAFLRYAGEPGRYQILMGGPSVDYTLLATNKDVQTLQNEFRKLTKRDDIQLLEVFWQGEWR